MALLSGCAGATPRGAASHLRVIAKPAGARVYVDERFIGTGRALRLEPARFVPGPHLVTVRAPGYFPHDLAVDLKPGLSTLRIALRPIPP